MGFTIVGIGSIFITILRGFRGILELTVLRHLGFVEDTSEGSLFGNLSLTRVRHGLFELNGGSNRETHLPEKLELLTKKWNCIVSIEGTYTGAKVVDVTGLNGG